MPVLEMVFIALGLVCAFVFAVSAIVSKEEKFRFSLDQTLQDKVSACAGELEIKNSQLITESILAFLSIQKLKKDDRCDAFYAEGDGQELNITKWFSIGHNYRRRSGDEQGEDE